MRLDLVTVAEGVTHDARGALTAVALNQRVLVQPQPLGPVNLTLLVIVSDEEDRGFSAPADHSVQVHLRGPAGTVLSATAQAVAAAAKNWAELPQFSNLVLTAPFLPELPGRYELEVVLEVDGASVDRITKSLYVVTQAEVAAHSGGTS